MGIAIRRKRSKRPLRVIKEDQHRINGKIRVPEVRLVGDNVEVGVYPTKKALALAEEQELDLVEISPKAVPPVCKIMDYKKFLKEGAKLRAYVFFKGRSIIYKDQGQILLLKLAQELEEFGKVEQMPKLEGKRMIMFMAPKKSK